jgi:hypothetical protein
LITSPMKKGLPSLVVRERREKREHVFLGKTAQQDALIHRLAPQGGEHLGEGMGPVEVDVAVGADHEQAQVADVARQVAQQQQRWLVGPVQVVEQEYQRLRAGRVAQEPGHALEQAHALGVALELHRLGKVGEALAHLGDEVRELGGAVAQLLAQGFVGSRAHVLTQGVDEGEEGDLHGALVGAALQDLRAAQARVDAELLGEPRLADSRLADQRGDRAATRERLLQRVLQLVHLLAAPDEAGEPAARGRVRRWRRGGR